MELGILADGLFGILSFVLVFLFRAIPLLLDFFGGDWRIGIGLG